MIVLHQTLSPGSHPGICLTHAGVHSCWLLVFGRACHSAVFLDDTVVEPDTRPASQSMFGLADSKNGYPKMKLSGPMLATKNLWVVSILLYQIFRVVVYEIQPPLLVVPLTFQMSCGHSNSCVRSRSCHRAQGWMKFSVAPLSSSAFLLTCLYRVHRAKGSFIAWFLAKYTDPVSIAWVRAEALRRPKNPHRLPSPEAFGQMFPFLYQIDALLKQRAWQAWSSNCHYCRLICCWTHHPQW